MKLWFGHGSEHSMNLVMIGQFEDARQAARAKQRIDQVTELVSAELDDGAIEVRVTDAHSDVASLLVLSDGDPRYRLRPIDGVADAPVELYRLDPPAGPGVWSVRGIDAAGNRADSPLPAQGS